MPSRPDKVEARSPRRFLIDVPGGKEEVRIPAEAMAELMEARAARQREEERREEEQKKKALRVRLEELFNQMENRWEEALDRADVEHKTFEYIDAFDNKEEFLWWLNYTLLTMNTSDIRESLEPYYEAVDEQRSDAFETFWSHFLHNAFNSDERELLDDHRHSERYNDILTGAYEGFDDEWSSAEEFNLDDVYKEIPLLAWRREIYYLPHIEERRAFTKEATKYLSPGTVNNLLMEAANRGYHLARIGAVFDGAVLARHAFFHVDPTARVPKASHGLTYIKICDKRGRCVYATSGKHINFEPYTGWEIDIGPNSFGQINGFERSTKMDQDTWYWSLEEEPERVKELRELFLSVRLPTEPGERGGGGNRLLPEGRYGFNIPPY